VAVLVQTNGPTTRFSLGPPTGSPTATSDVEIAVYRVKADTALLFGRLTAQRVGDFLCAGRYGWTDDGTQRSAIALSASSAQGGEHRAHDNHSVRTRQWAGMTLSVPTKWHARPSN
jgi:hypothetical protein